MTSKTLKLQLCAPGQLTWLSFFPGAGPLLSASSEVFTSPHLWDTGLLVSALRDNVLNHYPTPWVCCGWFSRQATQAVPLTVLVGLQGPQSEGPTAQIAGNGETQRTVDASGDVLNVGGRGMGPVTGRHTQWPHMGASVTPASSSSSREKNEVEPTPQMTPSTSVLPGSVLLKAVLWLQRLNLFICSDLLSLSPSISLHTLSPALPT